MVTSQRDGQQVTKWTAVEALSPLRSSWVPQVRALGQAWPTQSSTSTQHLISIYMAAPRAAGEDSGLLSSYFLLDLSPISPFLSVPLSSLSSSLLLSVHLPLSL